MSKKVLSMGLLSVSLALLLSSTGCTRKRCDSAIETCPVYSGDGYDGWDSGWDGGGGWDDGGGGWDDGGGDSGGGDSGGGDDGTYCDGTGFCYREGNPTSGRDTVANLGELERARVSTAGKKFAAKFGLSEDTGLNVAQVFYDYKMLGKNRTRTAAELNQLAERLYGLDLGQITNSISEMEKGNMAPMNAAIEDAADHWGTTPETMTEVLKDWYKDYLPK